MQRLLINRVAFHFKHRDPQVLIVRQTDDLTINKCKAIWIKSRLFGSDLDKFVEWTEEHNIEDGSYLSIEFAKDLPDQSDEFYYVDLTESNSYKFAPKIVKQELVNHLHSKGMLIELIKIPLDFSAYQKISGFNDNYDLYRRIDFLWKHKRNELVFNFGSERTLISRGKRDLEANEIAFNSDDLLVYRKHDGMNAKYKCSKEEMWELFKSPQKFSYKQRYSRLKEFAVENLYDISSDCIEVDKTGFKNVEPDDLNHVFSKQNIMKFAGEKTAINAVVGMREYGPLAKAPSSDKKRLLFIYQNRNDANTLYRYLKNGYKHFPGLLSYVGIPVALAEPVKGLPYENASSLPEILPAFLEEHFPKELYVDVLAIVIGPYKRYESDEDESEAYFHIKKLLLDKGIASQFVSSATLNSSGIHYSLPNIAIALLAKLGGVPWKLDTKKVSELVVGFNTKRVDGDRYLGSAVFFDNEGMLGQIQALPIDDRSAIISNLKEAIVRYTSVHGEPDRLVIHYYKPPRSDEINNIVELLQDMGLSIPIAVVEVNDSKSKLDIGFDADFDMGMPESGVFIKTGFNEYLLFNNNRYKKSTTQKIEDELPIKLKLSYVNTGGFHTNELIAQVYEFSRLNWKGLRQKRVPVTTTYSKMIAEFSSHFNGEMPDNEVANNIPWFI